MKRIFTIHLVLRVIPVVLFALLFLLDLASKASEGMEMRLCCYLLASAVIYVAYPLTRDEPSTSMRFSAVCSVFYIGAALMLDGPETIVYLFLLPTVLFTLVYVSAGLSVKYKEPSAVFRKDAAWCCAEEDSRSFYSFIILAACIALILLWQENAKPVVTLSASFFLLILDIVSIV